MIRSMPGKCFAARQMFSCQENSFLHMLPYQANSFQPGETFSYQKKSLPCQVISSLPVNLFPFLFIYSKMFFDFVHPNISFTYLRYVEGFAGWADMRIVDGMAAMPEETTYENTLKIQINLPPLRLPEETWGINLTSVGELPNFGNGDLLLIPLAILVKNYWRTLTQFIIISKYYS